MNKGNCLFHKKVFIRAKECYLEAIGVEADCVEALYNLAFVNKQLSNFSECLTALEKLLSISSELAIALYQMGSVHELLGDNRTAIKWFDLLLSRV